MRCGIIGTSKAFKMAIDIVMTILLILLMAFNIVGQKLHEVFGTGIFIVFILHNLLNYRWYKNLLKGRYSVYRIIQTVINFAILIIILGCIISGIMMSNYVFKFLSLEGNMNLARKIHMASSYWGYVLISMHLGMHWNMITNMLKKKVSDLQSNSIIVFMKFIGILIACYGAYAFIKHDILSNMLLLNHFANFGNDKSTLLFFIDYLAMMGFWIAVSYYAVKMFVIKKKSRKISDK